VLVHVAAVRTSSAWQIAYRTGKPVAAAGAQRPVDAAHCRPCSAATGSLPAVSGGRPFACACTPSESPYCPRAI